MRYTRLLLAALVMTAALGADSPKPDRRAATDSGFFNGKDL